METQDLSPSLRVALKTIFFDTVQEFSMLYKSLSCQSEAPQVKFSENEQSDALLAELNQIFIDALLKLNDFHQGDFICHSDGSCRKLSEDESHLHAFLTELGSKINVFKTLGSEIDLSGTFESLKLNYEQSKSAIDSPIHLTKRIIDNDQLIKFLQEKIAASQEHFVKQIDLYDELIRRLKHELQEAGQLSEMTLHYLNATYKERADELSRIRNEETGALSEETQGYLQRLNTEERVIYEDSSCMLSTIDEHSNRLKYLQSQTKVQDLTNDVENLVTSLEKLKINYETLKENFKEYNQVVLDYDAEQERIRQKEEYEQKLLEAIFKVQAWWRTMIVIRKIKVPTGHAHRKKAKGKSKDKK
ncbi:unnamed protein product [Rodentolepis nana]|uniref:Dynein regulatory complex protein 10 n=1 Tax=Rodentolepis nana TaxID=102285 RepID=A0A0R3TKP2_RODNA|nr:unnamed protein product [Rodentolepis nana]